jgi:hypothetical protein
MTKELDVEKIEGLIISLNKLIKEANGAKVILGLMITEKSAAPEERKIISVKGVKNLKKHTREIETLLEEIQKKENQLVISLGGLI